MQSMEHLQESTAAPADAPSKKEAKAAAKAAEKSAAAASGPPPEEKTAEELAKMSKEERKAYHLARRAAAPAPAEAQKPKQLSKAERRAMQEAQRKVKEDKAQANLEGDELLKELVLQGLTEEQAKVVIEEMNTAQNEDDDDDEDDEPLDLKSSVRRWMEEEDPTKLEDALHDFNMKVRFQGHVDSTPPDHVRCILSILVDQACADASFGSLKQPMAVAKKVEPSVTRWATILEPLYGKIGDVMAAADGVVTAIREAVAEQKSVKEESQACIVVGFLMALRSIDMIEDDDLLTGCKRADLQNVVMDKFITFLEELEDDDDDDDEDDD